MRTLGKKHRLQALSAAEVREPLDEVTLDYARRHKFQGRKLQLGPLLNAIVFRFLELPEADRERFAVEGLRRLESVLSEGDDGPSGEVGNRFGLPDGPPPNPEPKRRSG